MMCRTQSEVRYAESSEAETKAAALVSSDLACNAPLSTAHSNTVMT